MSYISAWRMGNDVLVWERTEQGRITKQYKGIFEFYTQHHDGEYTSIFDEKLVKHEFTNWFEFNDMRNMFTQGHVPLYESDIGPEMKILSKHYYNAPTPKLHFTMWDIEVDYDPEKGFSTVENPYAPINAVALFHHWKNESVVIAVPPAGWDWNNKLENLARETNTNIILVKSERELLINFVQQIQDTDVLSGWNSDFFDTPYLARRVEKVLGQQWFQLLSFPDSHPPRYRTVELYGQERVMCDLGGRISWDYMELFKKFEMNERPSYSLEAISNEILPELPKLSYTGTLHQLYNNDFEHFVRYNIRDTEVLGGFERVLGYLSLANELYHSACGQPNNILGTIKLTDLSIINYCHYVLDKKVPDCNPFAESTGIHGAMVLVPKRGLHDLLGSIDITSLYPSVIRSVNISPDTLVGQCEGVLTKDDRAKHSAWEAIYRGDPNEEVTVVYEPRSGMTGTETHTGLEWRSILKQRKWAVSGYGTFFSQEKQGIIPAVLTDWFGKRSHYKKLMKIAKDRVKELRQLETRTPEQEREMMECEEKASFYDRLQYVYKIKLNATYGATTNASFRFFDLRLGQSTTGSGRAVLQHMGSQVALLLDGKYDIHSESIVYGDSVAGDSVIYTDDNSNVRIEDLFGDVHDTIGEKEYHIPHNLRVLTYDEHTNSSCYKPVKYIMRHKNSKKMFRVWLTNATYIDVTEDHSLMGYVNTSLRKKGESCLREIKPEEFGSDIKNLVQVKTRPRYTCKSKNFSKEFYELLGLIVGDGGANHRQSGVELSIGASDLEEIKTKVIDPLIEQKWCTSFHVLKNGHDTRLCGTKLWDTVRQLLYVDGVKCIPDWLNYETSENIAHFLRGYFTADGGVTGNAVRLTSTNVDNIRRVQQLLTYCSIASNYFTETTVNTFKHYSSGSHSTNLVVKSKAQFKRVVGFILDRKQQAVPSSGRKDSYFDNIDFDITGVRKIEQIDYDDYVYDIEVEDTHTFFANNILVHNTDSIYFKTNAESFKQLSREQQHDMAIKIADQIGKEADNSFDAFCEQAFCIQPEFSGIVRCDREVVAKRGIFVTKKRYVLKLIDHEGYRVDKLKAMGLEMKKTTTPRIIRSFLEDVVNMILDDEKEWSEIDDFIVDFRKKVRTECPLIEIGLPKGVKKVEYYTDMYRVEGEKARLPGHVAASIHYNECLKKFGDKENPPITSGSKVKVFYLTKKYGKFKSIAFPTDLEQTPKWFDDNFECDRLKHESRLIDNNLSIIFDAIGRVVPTAQTQFNDDILEW